MSSAASRLRQSLLQGLSFVSALERRKKSGESPLTCAVDSGLQKDDKVGVELDVVLVRNLDLDGEVLVQVSRSVRANLDSYPGIPPDDTVSPSDLQMVRASSGKTNGNHVASLPACVGFVRRQRHALTCAVVPSHVVRAVSDRPEDELYGPAVDVRRKNDLLHLRGQSKSASSRREFPGFDIHPH